MTTEPSHIVVVGASAGGVEALSALLRELPAGLDAAVFVVLHVPPHAPSGLPSILQRVTRLEVVAAADHAPITAGRVYVAPADRHLMLQAGAVRITRGPRECRSRPSIDVLFRSAAQVYGARVIGVVLTGALDDGTAGLWAVKDRGGKALVQDPNEARHASMPDSAMRHVAVDAVLPVRALAQEVVRLTTAPASAPDPTSASASSAAPTSETPSATASQLPPAPAADAVPESLAIENVIALNGDGLRAGVMRLGRVSSYTCPDCHGVLVQIEHGSITRFRCHTGHAFSLKTLLAEVNEAIDTGLWDTLRAIEERILLLRQMGRLAHVAGDADAAALCESQAGDAEERVKPLRELVLDPRLFGHAPEGI